MFVHEIATHVDIDAPARRVWSILVDFPAHSRWNPFVQEITGMPQPGQRLKVSIRPPGGKGMTFRPVVLRAAPEQELRWLGRFLVPGLFDGEHYFRIEPLGPDRVRFIHGERFSGLLVGLARSSLDAGTRAGFEQMNQALKAQAEAPSGS